MHAQSLVASSSRWLTGLIVWTASLRVIWSTLGVQAFTDLSSGFSNDKQDSMLYAPLAAGAFLWLTVCNHSLPEVYNSVNIIRYMLQTSYVDLNTHAVTAQSDVAVLVLFKQHRSCVASGPSLQLAVYNSRCFDVKALRLMEKDQKIHVDGRS